MSRPLLSVIIPIYNSEDYLKNCLNSILHQSYENLEVILVNDGSTDSSGDLCDEFASKDSRIIVVHNVNSGVSSARNIGLEKFTGELIHFMDSDDHLSPDTYEKIVGSMLECDANIAFFGSSNSQGKDMTGEIPSGIVSKNDALKYAAGIVGDDGKTSSLFLGVTNKVFSREIVVDSEGKQLLFDTAMTHLEDGLFLVSTYPMWNKVYIDTNVYYQRTIRPGSAMGEASNQLPLQMVNGYQVVLNHAKSLMDESEAQCIEDAYVRATRYYAWSTVSDKKRDLFLDLVELCIDDRKIVRELFEMMYGTYAYECSKSTRFWKKMKELEKGLIEEKKVNAALTEKCNQAKEHTTTDKSFFNRLFRG